MVLFHPARGKRGRESGPNRGQVRVAPEPGFAACWPPFLPAIDVHVPQPRIAPLAAALCWALSATAVAADRERDDPSQWALCKPNALFDFHRSDLPGEGDRENSAAELSAMRFDVLDQASYTLQGDVQIRRADQFIGAERLRYDTQAQTYEAEGAVHYQDRGLLVGAERARGELESDRSTLQEVRYQLLDARGNGHAEQAVVEGETSKLSQVSYTTCDPGATGWQLRAARVDLDQAEGIGTARHATLRLGSVPILYLPYASFPIDERRRTGFLFPSIGSSQDSGIDIAAPYYINLAPNYDLTLTPRLMGRRGAMLGAEFRYLSPTQRGELSGTWLPDDDQTGDDRGSIGLQHFGALGSHWNVQANLNHVSDDRYFEDFGDSLTAASTSLLESTVGVHGRGQYWNASVSAQSWEITDPFLPDGFEPFRRLPRLTFGYERPLHDSVVAGVRSEAVAFDHEERAGAQRYDFYPYVAFPFERAAGYVRPEFGFRHTAYQLDRDYDANFATRSPSRDTPIASLDAGLFFERNASLFGKRMLQTLEPRLYYLRVPYEAQDDLPIFDTQELTFSFEQLFRPNRFTGADRQTDANQATVALTTRLLEEASGRERLSASLGQIRYFSPQRVQLPGQAITDLDGSALVADLDLTLSDQWRVGISQQWDPDQELSDLSALRAQYRWNPRGVLNLAYRFRREQNGALADQVALEQVDASFAAPISERWRLIGRWNYSLLDSSTLESVAGFEWESCCVAWRVLGRRYVRNREGEMNNGIYIELELKGLASLGRKSGELLERAILGYTR
jgi:LPS-assembly protein